MRFWKHGGKLQQYGAEVLCLLIFMLALQARIEHYSPGPHSAGPLTKLSKVRVEAAESKTLVTPVVIQLFVVAAVYGMLLCGQPLVRREFGAMIAHDLHRSYQELFLRPPPSIG